MADSRIPAYDISLDKALKQGGFYGTNGVWNSLVKVDGRVLRGRVEVLVFKKEQQQIFMHIKNYDEKKYRIPGGSYEKDTPNYIQAQNEVNEEARIKVKNLVNTGEHYVKLYKNPAPLYGSNFMWIGNYTEVYIGEYDGVYTGKIADEDKDENMYKYGKFYDISEVYPIMNDVHKKIIDSIFPSLNNENISESMIMLEEAKSEPHYYPYYTPFEMSKLGVFNENTNRYSDIQDEAIEWYLEYTDSLRNPDSENWLKELQHRYDTYKKEEPTAENKQLILHLGWNPEIPATIENVLIASGKTEKRLNESTDEKLVLDEGLIFSEKDIVLNIDDFESGKSNILFITGLAGSGKTTLAGTLEEQYGAEVISLDYFQHEASFYNGYFKEFKDTISYKLVDKYMKENPDIAKSRDSFNGISLEDFGDYFVPFFGWLVNTLRKNKDKKYIVEGIHILLFIPYKDISSYPLYCVNTSAIKSLVRHWKRDEWTIKDIVERGYGDLLKFKNWNDQYNRFKYGLKSDRVEKSNMLNEAMIYDPIGGGYIKSPFVEKDFVYTADMINNKLKKYHQEGEYMCIQPRDVESDDGGWIFAEYKILEKNDELNVVNFINEMNNWINNSILVGEVEMPEYIKEKGFLILRDSKKFLGETTILDESFLKNNEDFYYNIDKVDNGANKVIYVTGHSGSGKSTLLKELNERYPNLIGISGDYIVVAILRNLADEIPDVWDLNKNKVKNKIGDIPYSFLLSNQSWKNISLTGDKSKDFNNPEIAQYFYDFIIWLENESKKSKYNNNIFAVEGLQVITVPDLNFYNDKPLIIKGTSALTSYMRKQKRDLSHDTSWDKIKNSIIGMIPKYIEYNADMRNLQRIMGETSAIQESQSISRKKAFDDSVKLLKKEMAKYPSLSSVVSIETHGDQWVKDFVNNKSTSCMIAGVSVWDVIPNARENADMIDDKVSKPMENIVKELNKKSPQGYYFDIDGDWDYYMININADETLNESVIHEISSKSYYRVTFHNTGIYEALKRILTKDEWELLLTDPGITWLPKPPEYAEGYVSYFTAYGYKMFEMHTYPLIEKYFDDDITVVQIKELDADSIIYRDKYQVVVDISISESCKNVEDARRFVRDVDKLAKKYDANYFIVTDGASGTRNGTYGDKVPNDAVKNARNAQKEWEKENGFDPDEDWVKNESSYFPNTGYMNYDSYVYNNGEYLEERGSNSMKPLLDLYNNISNNEYGIVYNGKVIVGDIDFGKQYKTISVKDFEKYRAGVCWDFARYQEYILKKSYSNVQNYYIILDFAPNYPTHTFTIVKIGNKYYYIEVSWEKYKGIYEADKVIDILNCVAHRQIEFVNAPSNVRIECRKYTDSDKLINMNPVEYMSWMDAQQKVTIYPQKADESKLRKVNVVYENMEYTNNIEYGLPELKKYPIPDEKHVLSTIRFFNYVSPANEEELARNIKKKMKQYDIPPSKVGNKNRLKKYLKEDADIVQELQVYCTDEKCKPVLVFDIGSVLVDSKKDYLDSLYNSSLIPDKLVQEIHDYIMDTYKDNTEYLAYCTTREYYKFMTDNAPEGLQKYIPAAININVESLKKLPYTDNLLKRLKDRGYTICYLSNWDRWSRDELVKNGTFDFLKYFDNGIFSCDVKCLKPDHKIYKKFLELCDKTTNNIIFFDDRADNIRAAMEVGMYGILFDKDYTPQYICDTFLSGEPIEEMVNYLNEEGSYNIEKTKDTYMMKNEKGQVISKIKYFDYKMKNFNWVLIADVETNPSYRKMGLASKLLNEVYKDVKEESDNKKGIYVFVRQNNKNAIALYKKLRFSTIKEYKLSDGDYFIMAKGSADRNQFNNMNFK